MYHIQKFGKWCADHCLFLFHLHWLGEEQEHHFLVFRLIISGWTLLNNIKIGIKENKHRDINVRASHLRVSLSWGCPARYVLIRFRCGANATTKEGETLWKYVVEIYHHILIESRKQNRFPLTIVLIGSHADCSTRVQDENFPECAKSRQHFVCDWFAHLNYKESIGILKKTLKIFAWA